MSHAPAEHHEESHAPHAAKEHAATAEHAEVHTDLPWYRKIAKSVLSAVKKVYQFVLGDFVDGFREGWREGNPIRAVADAHAAAAHAPAAAHGGGGH